MLTENTTASTVVFWLTDTFLLQVLQVRTGSKCELLQAVGTLHKGKSLYNVIES